MASEQFRDSHCNKCVRNTRHRLTVTHNRNPVPNEKGSGWFVEHEDIEVTYRTPSRKIEILECCGCGELHFVLHESRERVEVNGRARPLEQDPPFPYVKIRRFPAEVNRKMPDWAQISDDFDGWILSDSELVQYQDESTRDVPIRARNLLAEVYGAMKIGANSLAAMGIRTIIDGTCDDKVGDSGGFEQKLKALVDGEFISSRDRDILSSVVTMGHAATHRGHQPTISDITSMLDIVENMLAKMYLEPMQAEQLRERAPHRKSNKK